MDCRQSYFYVLGIAGLPLSYRFSAALVRAIAPDGRDGA